MGCLDILVIVCLSLECLTALCLDCQRAKNNCLSDRTKVFFYAIIVTNNGNINATVQTYNFYFIITDQFKLIPTPD